MAFVGYYEGRGRMGTRLLGGVHCEIWGFSSPVLLVLLKKEGYRTGRRTR